MTLELHCHSSFDEFKWCLVEIVCSLASPFQAAFWRRHLESQRIQNSRARWGVVTRTPKQHHFIRRSFARKGRWYRTPESPSSRHSCRRCARSSYEWSWSYSWSCHGQIRRLWSCCSFWNKDSYNRWPSTYFFILGYATLIHQSLIIPPFNNNRLIPPSWSISGSRYPLLKLYQISLSLIQYKLIPLPQFLSHWLRSHHLLAPRTGNVRSRTRSQSLRSDWFFCNGTHNTC